MIDILLWVFGTIIIGTLACLLGKRMGVEYLIAMFVGSIVIANAVANKIIAVGPFTATAGIVVYSITFLITDSISEFWGKKEAKKAVWSGFFALLMLVFVTHMSIYITPASYWDGQEAFVRIFGNTWRVVLASIVAYTISQNHDVWAYHFWKKKTNGKHLWLRNNASTWASQIIDTIFFVTIAFYGIIPVIPVILGSISLKVIIAAIDTPFIYFMRWYFEKVKPRWKSRLSSLHIQEQ